MEERLDTLTCEYGRAVSYTVTLRDANGSPITTTYAGTEALAGKVWAGDDRASLVTPTVAWASAADGTLTVSMTSAQTDDLSPGTYVLSVDLTDGGEPYECFRAWLRVEAVAGAATAGTTFCTFDDMIDVAGDLVEDLQNRADVAGFAEQREEAARWTRKTIRTRADSLGRRRMEQHQPITEQTPISITDGLDDGPDWGPSLYPDTTLRTHLDLVMGWVDSGYLMQDVATVISDAVAASPAPSATSFAGSSALSSTNDFYNDCRLFMTSGTYANQSAIVTDYVGSTYTLTLGSGLTGAPTAADTFTIKRYADDEQPLRTANALYAVGLVYRRQHGESAKGETYRMMAARMFAEAIRLIASYTFRFDLDADGTVDRELEPV
jgi:hypothetical protein